MSIKPKSNKKLFKLSTSYVAKMALLTALSFILYVFCKFSLPFIFPQFLDIQFSELPALLAGFSMGPLSGCLVIVFKCLLKFPLTSTAFVGELTDMVIGIAFVLPASLIYSYHKNRKHAILGLGIGLLIYTIVSVILNRFVSIPFYLKVFFNNNWNILLSIVKPLYPNVTVDNFYKYYLLLAIVPFNLLRGGLISIFTFFLYKRLSKLLHWDGDRIINKADKNNVRNCTFIAQNIKQTNYLAEIFAKTLVGGEVVLLNGDLGAGKTTFTKGLGKALGIDPKKITSPTFTIMKEYKGTNLSLYHYDMYRLEVGDESVLGIEEFLYSKNAVCVVEWNKFELEKDFIQINITSLGKKKRKFVIEEK
ncbi:MAG: tRNA (adenosine(37)-N6)-threonylcarbamoyltransferase complex ATPase subunit type 1 TsaE [Clostridia bacterium]